MQMINQYLQNIVGELCSWNMVLIAIIFQQTIDIIIPTYVILF